MRKSLKNDIFQYIKEKGPTRPQDLKDHFAISAVAVHKHLKTLLLEKKILKHGNPPLVFYSVSVTKTGPSLETSLPTLDAQDRQFVEDRYLYVSPTGELIPGLRGFDTWARGFGMERQIPAMVDEYRKIRQQADHFIQTKTGLIDATEKLKNTFVKIQLDGVFYKDFYSLPKYGKTKLGAYLLYAKQGQNAGLIRQIAEECGPVINSLIQEKSIDAVAFIPHSIPRKLQFLREFEKNLRLSLPKIEIVKAYTGSIPVPQKTLAKLEERIQNAQGTFFLKQNFVPAKNVLLIDDAVGSGATMNEIAAKIRASYRPLSLFGFAIVGSYKGFEVIREV